MRQQVVGFCELYMLVMGSWSVMGGSTLIVNNDFKDEEIMGFKIHNMYSVLHHIIVF